MGYCKRMKHGKWTGRWRFIKGLNGKTFYTERKVLEIDLEKEYNKWLQKIIKENIIVKPNLNFQNEIWKRIKYFPEYEVSNFGRVKSFKRDIINGKIRKFYIDIYGYKTITLIKNSKLKTFTIHRLVIQAFKSNPENKSQINHIDGNKLNNKIENLEWCTCSENLKHAYKLGLKSNKGEKASGAKLTEGQVLEIRELYKTRKYTYNSLGEIYKISYQSISDIIKRRTWTHI